MTARQTQRPSAPGKIWLVGAGPGDPELLTIKAARVIGMADVILVDALVNRAVLVYARPHARVVETGKRGGGRSTAQAFIERLMLHQAAAGHSIACARCEGRRGIRTVAGVGPADELVVSRAL